MVYQDSTNLNNVSKYIVDVSGDTPYTTIQAAIDAANAAGGNACVYVRPGTYTENLTLYDSINLWGDRGGLSIIIGTHTPPATGSIEIHECQLRSATDILNSAAAGTTNIEINDCFILVTNGYVFNLPNWTGELLLDDCGEASTNDGVVNNTGGCSIKFLNTEMGAGNANVMTLTGNGNLRFDTCNINCPINIGGTGTLVFQESVKCANTVTIGGAKIATLTMGNRFENTLTTADTATIIISDTTFETGANAAITHGSANELSLSDVTIDTSANPCIAGAGAGNLLLGSVTYLDNSTLAGTLTISRATKLDAGEVEGTDATFTGNFTQTGGTTDIGTDAAANNINIGTGAAAKTITIGNTTGASAVNIDTGTGDFTLDSATGNIITALDTGEITKPLQPAFLAYVSSTINNVTGTGTAYTVIFDTEVFDQNADYNTASGVFTAPVTGRYFLQSLVCIGGTTQATQFAILIATSNRNYYNYYRRAASNQDHTMQISSLCDMDAADIAYIVIAVAGEAGDTDDVLGDATNCVASFSGHLVC